MAALQDSRELREVLNSHWEGLQITDVAKASGQRVVYFAKSSNFQRGEEQFYWSEWGDFVLKVADGSNPYSAARLQQETEVLSNLNSKYYPKQRFFELLTFDPRTDMALNPKLYVTIEERVKGNPLSLLMANYGDEKSIRDLLIQLVNGLEVIWSHKKRYVHRDIKPDNILITNEGQVVIIDLGIMRETGSEGLTHSGHDFGPCTFDFASPEQATNNKNDITFKSDIFALGTLSYLLISGFNPFNNEAGLTGEKILEKVINYVPRSLHEIANVSNDFSLIIQKMMAKEPYKRYRRAKDLINDLKNC